MQTFEELNSAQIEWLINPESLTKRLREFTDNKISLHVLYDDWGMTDQNQEAWIRRIEWRHFDEIWIIATVIIPGTSITEETAELKNIGGKPIGEILFKEPTLTYSDFIFEKINKNEWLRQRTFYFKQKPLMIFETFLPAFFSAINAKNKILFSNNAFR